MEKERIPLENFQKSSKEMIAINDNAYKNNYLRWDGVKPIKDYSIEEVENIIKRGSLEAQRKLSRDYANNNSFYRQIISYYSTLLNFYGILIPKPVVGKSLQEISLKKKYFNAVDFLDIINIKELGPHIIYKVLVDGVYYGAIQTLNKRAFSLLDLPADYCRTRFKNEYNDLVVEFNVQYFDSIFNEYDRETALNSYPEVIANYYRVWVNNKGSLTSWMFLPDNVGIAFNLFVNKPYFLDIIPSTLKYDESLSNEQRRQMNKIKKILINKIPHLNDGSLLFEPDEAQVMHEGIVGMLKYSNPDISVVTTYGDTNIEDTSTVDGVTNNVLESMSQNIYSSAGTSGELFAAQGSSSLPYSINADISLMMNIANKIALFVTNLINRVYSNGVLKFKYTILPVSNFTLDKYVDSCFKMASSGYSLLLPNIALGLSQSDLINIKELENNVLDLPNKLIPPKSSYTSSSKESSGESGRPTLEPGEESEQTIKNKESIDNSGR